MIEINTKSKQFQNVLAKAIAVRPLVRLGEKDGLYLVRGSSGDFYPVQFQRGGGGRPLGACLCVGAVRGFHCYHLAAALLVHSAYVSQGLRRAASKREMKMSGELPEIAEAMRVPRFACRPQVPMFA